MTNGVLNFFEANACASISMRTQEEIHQKQIHPHEKHEYIKRILDGEKLKLALSWQTSDGYFGTRFHTPPSNSKVWPHEGCVRYLLELGLGFDFTPLKKSLDVLLVPGWNRECTGTAADAFGYGMIRASLFAQAGLHEYDFVHEWIEVALQGFRFVAEAAGFDDIAIPYKGKYVFVDGKYLPTIYLLRILAFTQTWRTPENIGIIEKAYSNLYTWLPFPPTYIKRKSQLVAPGGNIMFAFNQDINEPIGVWWFFFYELSARLGMMGKDSPFYKHLHALNGYLDENEGLFMEKYDKRGYVIWSGYSGLALEDNWTKWERRVCDLTFRSYLINAIANNLK